MSTARFDAFTRHAATGISRRNTFLTLSGAGLSAALGSPLTAARQSGKKKAKKKCKRQVGQCKGFFTNVCGDEANCPEAFACCSLLATCDAGGFVACIGDLEI